MYIDLNTVARVKDFVQVAQSFSEEITLRSGKYVVDAKSILGIFSIDNSSFVINNSCSSDK